RWGRLIRFLSNFWGSYQTGRGAFLHGAAGSGGGMCPHGKVILFSKSRWIFATAKGNGCLFVENTQSLFEKSKTDVQGAENRFV
ncbi:hypothetical protein, partial [uncultured Faecalibacterium sp.]|uniref:hypothetical protein n=1 Tax=uncultured Faecalibacterium sp. TaxID=259315 RepID=UPI0026DA9011